MPRIPKKPVGYKDAKQRAEEGIKSPRDEATFFKAREGKDMHSHKFVTRPLPALSPGASEQKPPRPQAIGCPDCPQGRKSRCYPSLLPGHQVIRPGKDKVQGQNVFYAQRKGY